MNKIWKILTALSAAWGVAVIATIWFIALANPSEAVVTAFVFTFFILGLPLVLVAAAKFAEDGL